MPPVTPRRTRAICGPSVLVAVLDLPLGDLLERHRQIVLRARLDERGWVLVERAPELVVDDHVVELVRLLELRAGDAQPLLDLRLALGRAPPQPALVLLEARGSHENGHRPRHPLTHAQCAFRLEVEQRDTAAGLDAVDLAEERSRPRPPRELDPFEEVALADFAVEFV